MNPRIRHQFSIVAHSPDIVELRYGAWNPVSFTFRDDTQSGSLARLILRFDGTAPLEQIGIEESVSLAEVQRLVEELSDLGVLESEARNVVDFILDHSPGSGGDPVDSPAAVMPIEFVGDVDVANELSKLVAKTLPAALNPILGTDNTLWNALNDQDLSSAEDGLRYHAAHEQFEGLRGKFVLLATTFVDPIRLKRLNRVCLQQRTSWLHACIDGPFIFIGPLVTPYQSACFECFETRLMMNLRESGSYLRYKEAILNHTVTFGQTPAKALLQSLLVTHAAVEAVNFLLTGHACTVNKVLSIYVPTMEFAYHDILRVPNCGGCGTQTSAVSRELYFDNGATERTPTE